MTKRKQEYKKYLKSKHWKKKREEVFKRQGKRCRICFSTRNVQVHHKKYRHNGESVLYKEKNAGLLPLCRDCHELWHELHGYKKIPFVRLHTLLHYGIPKRKAFEHPYSKHGIKPFRLVSTRYKGDLSGKSVTPF